MTNATIISILSTIIVFQTILNGCTIAIALVTVLMYRDHHRQMAERVPAWVKNAIKGQQ